MTGLGPADLLSGGRRYFDALVAACAERREKDYEATALLAGILEVQWACYRALVALGGGKPPAQVRVERPGPKPKRQAVNWRALRDRVQPDTQVSG